jgi:hypothetical protein
MFDSTKDGGEQMPLVNEDRLGEVAESGFGVRLGDGA